MGLWEGNVQPEQRKLSKWNTFCVVQPYSGTRSWMRTSCTSAMIDSTPYNTAVVM